MTSPGKRLSALLTSVPVVPVVTISDADVAVPLAEALAAGGLRVIEITLRTPAALDAIERIGRSPLDCIVGAGTILTPEQMRSARSAGATFGVSPGTSGSLLEEAERSAFPYLPAAATPSEAMALQEQGWSLAKFFPAEAVGGTAALKVLQLVVPELRWCPTGGLGPENAASYLALTNVICVGGSWVTPEDAIAAHDWARIEALARKASEQREPA